jgi:hypothetical protein
MSSRFLTPGRALLLCAAAWMAFPVLGAESSPAEKIKQALAQSRDLEVDNQPLDLAVNQLREQTGINLVTDQVAVPPAATIPGQGMYAHLRVTARSEGRPVREGLAKALRPHGLTFVVVGDTVFVTTPEKAAERQFGQAVHLDVEQVSLQDLLHHLARSTGANLVLDQRLANKEGQTPLTAHLDDVPLETAVELLADQAGLKAIRLGNVLYVTTEARAEKLRRPAPAAAAAPATGWQVWPDGTGGFRLTPPAGLPGAALIGFAGLGGMGGAGIAGGGMLGAIGFGGGIAGGIGGVAPPVPLTPPMPTTKPAPPKPKVDPPAPAKPAATPGKPAAPAAPDKKPDPASAPRPSTPRSRRRRHRRERHDTGGREAVQWAGIGTRTGPRCPGRPGRRPTAKNPDRS